MKAYYFTKTDCRTGPVSHKFFESYLVAVMQQKILIFKKCEYKIGDQKILISKINNQVLSNPRDHGGKSGHLC